MKAAELIGTVAGVGHLRPASGTWGSLAALPLLWAVHQIGSFPLVVLATLVVFFAGWWATRAMTAGRDNHDPSEIVIDEVAGQWVALFPVSYGAMFAGVPITALWPGWVVGFLAFRLFDILKPGPVGWADRRDDPLGVMLDDVIAGALAALVVAISGALYHVFLM
ncbi:phosphatidylglycerophosphatase A [Pseudooceanicola atlanticus]|uniref:Phosphatidylglycerophosphatase A n=1 Tax=Pseudooceanicola atlanticus TaxID=1461694 RepID=A0A0A0EDZ6_9RHOB|nr:phosphatidylglycerophosphatase A [Pseudooceanicola atlanticus]KGM47402.1 phosphatidylglycerophosphatase [Pseudooceanicola atlanticus]